MNSRGCVIAFQSCNGGGLGSHYFVSSLLQVREQGRGRRFTEDPRQCPFHSVSASPDRVCTSTFSYQHTFPAFPHVCIPPVIAFFSSLTFLTQIPAHAHLCPHTTLPAQAGTLEALQTCLQGGASPPLCPPYTQLLNPYLCPSYGQPIISSYTDTEGRLTCFMAPVPQTRVEIHKGKFCRNPAP